MSIFEPKWMSDNPFYPSWMGGVKVIVDVVGVSSSENYPIEFHFEKEKIKLYIEKIVFTQNESHQTEKSQNYYEFNKLEVIPEIKIKTISFG